MKKIVSFFVLFLLFDATVCNAQMVNTGEMYISKNTSLVSFDDFENTNLGHLSNNGQLYLHANFSNTGFVDFDGRGTSTSRTLSVEPLTIFQGSVPQTINAGEDSYFYNVEFANTAGGLTYNLDGVISVEGTANFMSGIVNNLTSGGEVHFEKNARAENAGDDSYVNGFVTKWGMPEFIYPIGHRGVYRPSIVGLTGSDEDRFDSNYMFERLGGDYTKHAKVKLVDESEYWLISSDKTEFDPSNLTLTWNARTTSPEVLSEDSSTQMGIVRLNTVNNQWEYITTVDLDEDTNSVTASITRPGTYTLARVFEFIPDDLVVYTDLMPGSGTNEYMNIRGIEFFPDNTLTIINRWGVKVYEASGYGQGDKWFRGYSEGNVTVDKKNILPSGTYYYFLKYKTQSGEDREKSGYLYIN